MLLQKKVGAVMDNNLENMMIEEEDHQSDRWMMTFSDLLSLVLTFFVLIYSLSEIDLEKWHTIKHSLISNLNPNSQTQSTIPTKEFEIKRLDDNKATDIDYLVTILRSNIAYLPETKELLTISRLDDRIILSIPYDSVFKTDSVEIRAEIIPLLDVIANALYSLKNHIDIYGNASEDHIVTNMYPSYWNLAIGRAIVLSKYLRNNGYQYKITPYGRIGSNFEEFIDIAPEIKQRLNKSIDIIVREFKAGDLSL